MPRHGHWAKRSLSPVTHERPRAHSPVEAVSRYEGVAFDVSSAWALSGFAGYVACCRYDLEGESSELVSGGAGEALCHQPPYRQYISPLRPTLEDLANELRGYGSRTLETQYRNNELILYSSESSATRCQAHIATQPAVPLSPVGRTPSVPLMCLQSLPFYCYLLLQSICNVSTCYLNDPWNFQHHFYRCQDLRVSTQCDWLLTQSMTSF